MTSAVHHGFVFPCVYVNKALGPGCWLASVDLKDAYFSMAMKEDTAELLGLRLPTGEYYRFRSCPFGTSQAPAWCQRLTECIKKQLSKEGIKCVVYLDDILICATTKEECAKDWHRLKELAS